MHRPVWVAHGSFIKGLHTTKNTASGNTNGGGRFSTVDLFKVGCFVIKVKIFKYEKELIWTS